MASARYTSLLPLDMAPGDAPPLGTWRTPWPPTLPRPDSKLVTCITGTGLKTPDVLHERLCADVTIEPSLRAFDRALADLKSGAGATGN